MRVLGPDDSVLLSWDRERGPGGSIDRLLDKATTGQELCILSPLVDDPEIIGRLIAAAERGAQVKVVTGLGEQNRIKGSFEYQLLSGADLTDSSRHEANIQRLARIPGIRVRSLRCLPHAKLVLLKGLEAIFSSVNLSPNAMARGQAESVEAGIRMAGGDLLDDLGAIFKQLWEHAPIQFVLSGPDISIREIGSRAPTLPRREAADLPVIAWSGPGFGAGICETLVSWIRNARKDIILAALSFYDAEDLPEFYLALLAALDRGVRITVVVRPENFSPSRYPDPSTRKLVSRGLVLFGEPGLHAKGILVDDVFCGITSANFNPFSLNPGLPTSHFEMAIFGKAGSPLLARYAWFLQYLVQRAPVSWNERELPNTSDN